MAMPLLGFLLGIGFSEWIETIDHWIAFILLSLIGVKMIKESFDKSANVDNKVDFKTMSMLAIATSIDALAIGIITFAISLFGVKIGNKFGVKYGNKAELVGGLILIFIGTKILIEHTIL